MSALSLRRVSKSFGADTVLHPTDIDISSGEFLVILGASGCGKSTLLRLIAGLETPSAGEIWLDEIDITVMPPAARGIAMVFQSYALYPHLSVAQNIGFPLRMAGVPKAAIAERVGDVAQQLGLTKLLDARPRTLSGGQRQRVSIGRALVREPAILLLDEPLSNLDAGLRAQLRHEFARLHQRLGSTMIYVTHDHLEAMTLANRIIVMAEGRIIQTGAPLELYRRPACITVATAIGSPRINLIPVRIIARVSGGTRVRLPDGAEANVAVIVPAEEIGAPATLGVRPEHLTVDAEGPLGGPVELFERIGPLSFAYLGSEVLGKAIVAQLPAAETVTLGERLRFCFATSDAMLFDEGGDAYATISP